MFRVSTTPFCYFGGVVESILHRLHGTEGRQVQLTQRNEIASYTYSEKVNGEALVPTPTNPLARLETGQWRTMWSAVSGPP